MKRAKISDTYEDQVQVPVTSTLMPDVTNTTSMYYGSSYANVSVEATPANVSAPNTYTTMIMPDASASLTAPDYQQQQQLQMQPQIIDNQYYASAYLTQPTNVNGNTANISSIDTQYAATTETDAANQSDDNIRTLFVSGLPLDIKLREVHNFFRFFEGFDFATLDVRGRGPVGFATFKTHENARQALVRIDNQKFDPFSLNTAEIVHAEFAKKNSFKPLDAKKMMVGANGFEGTPTQNFLNRHAAMTSEMINQVNPMYAQPQQNMAAAVAPVQGAAAQQGQSAYAPSAYGYGTYPTGSTNVNDPVEHVRAFAQYFKHMPLATQPPSKNTPCSTIFVGSIPNTIQKEDVAEAFKFSNGFSYIAGTGDKGPIAFVEYGSVDVASKVREIMNNFHQPNQSFREGLFIDYAKNKMKASR